MRRFYLSNRIQQPAAELSWSQHVELLPITNKADKRRLEQRIFGEKLSPRQIREEVRQLKQSQEASKQDKVPVMLPPPYRELPLQCFELIALITSAPHCLHHSVFVLMLQ
jgi:hypothetical protein